MANLPVPTPRTFTASEVEVAAYFNAIRDALLFLLNPPICVVYQTTAQTLVSGTASVVSMDTTQVDTYGGHSNVTTNQLYTAQVAGWYLVVGTVQFGNTAGGDRTISIQVNGTGVTWNGMAVPSASVNVFPTVTCAAFVQLPAGSTVNLSAFQNSGGAVALHTLGSSMAVIWIHA